MATSTMQIRFPRLGVVRRFGLHQEGRQAEYGTPWAFNVRTEDSLTNRLRGGSFVGSEPREPLCPIVYRDRKITYSENAITASRVGNPLDTTMSADLSDMLRPVLFQFSEAGKKGGDVRAIVPHKDRYLLCFSEQETWVQHGDPLSGPRHRVSDRVGIVGANAWCIAHDTVYFLSALGLYSVSADGSGLKEISGELIPKELIGLESDEIFLDYDHATSGVSIHLTGSPSWFYDTERGGFWPFGTSTTQSHVLLGPMQLGRGDTYGRILDIHGTVAQGSGTVTWAIVPGNNAEQAAANGKLAIEAAVAGNSFASYVSQTGTWSAGRSHRAYPRTRAVACCIWLSATAAWAYEAVSIMVLQSGKWR